MSEAHDCGLDAAAYVLGALEPAEAERFERHLQGCVVCQAEVASLQEAADALPLAVPAQRASSQLRQRVMAEVRADVQARARAERRAGGRRAAPTRGRLLAPGLALVVAALAFLGVELAGSGVQTHVYNASVGDAQLRISGGHAELVVHKLPPPGANNVYELWLARGTGAPRPAEVDLHVSGAGDGTVTLPEPVRRGTAVMVTAEPAPGTPHPTVNPVIIVRA